MRAGRDHRSPGAPVSKASETPADSAPLRIGSLFSGYGGLDLAVEHVFRARTIWFSEISPVRHVFAHHWPDAPNLGDITAIKWAEVEPVDILCGGFPCQDVSTVGKMAGLAPGTRSGLWSYMAEAIEQLRPEFVVIENVRGLVSAPAIRATPEGGNRATPEPATLRDLEPGFWGVGDDTARPLRAIGAVLGDLADIGYDAQWIGLPASAVGAPHPRFRVFILAHAPVQNSARVRCSEGRREPGSGECQVSRLVEGSFIGFSGERVAGLPPSTRLRVLRAGRGRVRHGGGVRCTSRPIQRSRTRRR